MELYHYPTMIVTRFHKYLCYSRCYVFILFCKPFLVLIVYYCLLICHVNVQLYNMSVCQVIACCIVMRAPLQKCASLYLYVFISVLQINLLWTTPLRSPYFIEVCNTFSNKLNGWSTSWQHVDLDWLFEAFQNV